MGIAENIDALLVRFDITQESLARAVGVSQAAVSGWRHGKRPSNSTLNKICRYYKLEPNDILSDENGLANKEHRGYVPPIANALPVKAGDWVAVPLRGRVHAGKPTEAENIEAREQLIEIPAFLVQEDPETYVAIAEGDCMDKVYPEGCIIAISPNKQPQNGSVAVVTIDGIDTVMRRMYKTAKTLVLSPDSYNPEHEDIIITQESEHTVSFGGKVVWFQSNGEME